MDPADLDLRSFWDLGTSLVLKIRSRAKKGEEDTKMARQEGEDYKNITDKIYHYGI